RARGRARRGAALAAVPLCSGGPVRPRRAQCPAEGHLAVRVVLTHGVGGTEGRIGRGGPAPMR
ncbi:MAG: hypothetical protein JWL64_1039, partial [Frankiales bacterium]|nr:hypothetical protein [Frankiales bacterium]